MNNAIAGQGFAESTKQYRGVPNAINLPPPKDTPKILAKLDHLNKAIVDAGQRLNELEERLRPITYPQDSEAIGVANAGSPVFVMQQLDSAVVNVEGLTRRIENLIMNCYL